MLAYQEYTYRKMFGLSKREMADEPMEDVMINFKIEELLAKKQRADRAIVEEKVRRSTNK